MDDPFAVLGLPPTATLAEVRAARRRLARALHPDHGGDETSMREVNRAFDLAVKALLRGTPGSAGAAPSAAPAAAPDPPARPRPSRSGAWRGRRTVEHDSPSFTIELLPAEAFEALLIVVSWIGDVAVDDPPYLLDAHLQEPAPCWCRLELLPEAGGSTVSLTVVSVEDHEAPAAEEVRDLLITLLGQLGRPE